MITSYLSPQGSQYSVVVHPKLPSQRNLEGLEVRVWHQATPTNHILLCDTYTACIVDCLFVVVCINLFSE